MKLPASVLARLVRWALAVMTSRQPDFVIGEANVPYLLRWFAIRRNPLANVYLHEFRRDDDDRALHDHPWVNVSIVLTGAYIEHTISAGGIHHRRRRNAGDIVVRSPWAAHRIELLQSPCRTLFLTGPRLRSWGFHCPNDGWVDWKRFTDPDDHGKPGPGCSGGRSH